MMQIGTAVARASQTEAGRIERRRVVGEAGIAQVEHAARRIGTRGAACAGGYDAVEHVDATLHCTDKVIRRAYAHEIARSIRWEVRDGRVQHREGGGLALADREAANGVAVETDGRERSRGGGPEVRVDAA